MLSVSAYYENGVFVPLEDITLKERQQVIVTVLDMPKQVTPSKEEAIAKLRSLCRPGKHVWAESPADYVRNMRDDERI